MSYQTFEDYNKEVFSFGDKIEKYCKTCVVWLLYKIHYLEISDVFAFYGAMLCAFELRVPAIIADYYINSCVDTLSVLHRSAF